MPLNCPRLLYRVIHGSGHSPYREDIKPNPRFTDITFKGDLFARDHSRKWSTQALEDHLKGRMVPGPFITFWTFEKATDFASQHWNFYHFEDFMLMAVESSAFPDIIEASQARKSICEEQGRQYEQAQEDLGAYLVYGGLRGRTRKMVFRIDFEWLCSLINTPEHLRQPNQLSWRLMHEIVRFRGFPDPDLLRHLLQEFGCTADGKSVSALTMPGFLPSIFEPEGNTKLLSV